MSNDSPDDKQKELQTKEEEPEGNADANELKSVASKSALEKGEEGESTVESAKDEESVVSHARPIGDWESMVPTVVPEPVVRESWSNQVDFLMTCISMSVGFGNIYRFPFVAYENGGGAFLIPYVIVMFVVGRPMYFFELLVGQFSSRGCVEVWEMAPAFKGIGYAMVIASACTVTFYSSIMATIILYAIYSFWPTLPWAGCKQDDLILDGKTRYDVHCESVHDDLKLKMSLLLPQGNNNITGGFCTSNESCFEELFEVNKAGITGGNGSDAEVFFQYQVLKVYTEIDHGIGLPDWKLSLCLLITWAIIYFIVVRGVTGSGKIAWFTAMFPYVILITLFGVSVSLPNAVDGIKYFFAPQWSKLLQVNLCMFQHYEMPVVWFQAVQQCFFSLGMGFGPVIVFGSYNNFRHNIARDVWIVSAMDAFTSLLAGSTIFAILGSLAQGRDISTVVESGPNIAFVSYPSVMKDFGPYPIPQIISFLFFFMLLILGLGSGTSMTNTVVTVLIDKFPCVNRYILSTSVCVVGFFIGLIYCTPGGNHMLLLIDTFGSSLVLYVVVLTEIIVVAWIYGLRNWVNDIEFMLKEKLVWFWKMCWGFIIPAGLLFVMIYNFVTFETPRVGDYPLPPITIWIGIAISVTIIGVIPGVGVYVIVTRKTHSIYKKIRAGFSPSRAWGPKDPELKEAWEDYKRSKPYRYHPWKIFSKDYWKRHGPCHYCRNCRRRATEERHAHFADDEGRKSNFFNAGGKERYPKDLEDLKDEPTKVIKGQSKDAKGTKEQPKDAKDVKEQSKDAKDTKEQPKDAKDTKDQPKDAKDVKEQPKDTKKPIDQPTKGALKK